MNSAATDPSVDFAPRTMACAPVLTALWLLELILVSPVTWTVVLPTSQSPIHPCVPGRDLTTPRNSTRLSAGLALVGSGDGTALVGLGAAFVAVEDGRTTLVGVAGGGTSTVVGVALGGAIVFVAVGGSLTAVAVAGMLVAVAEGGTRVLAGVAVAGIFVGVELGAGLVAVAVGGTGVGAGTSLLSPGNESALISLMFVYPSMSESMPSIAVKLCA